MLAANNRLLTVAIATKVHRVDRGSGSLIANVKVMAKSTPTTSKDALCLKLGGNSHSALITVRASNPNQIMSASETSFVTLTGMGPGGGGATPGRVTTSKTMPLSTYHPHQRGAVHGEAPVQPPVQLAR